MMKIRKMMRRRMTIMTPPRLWSMLSFINSVMLSQDLNQEGYLHVAGTGRGHTMLNLAWGPNVSKQFAENCIILLGDRTGGFLTLGNIWKHLSLLPFRHFKAACPTSYWRKSSNNQETCLETAREHILLGFIDRISPQNRRFHSNMDRLVGGLVIGSPLLTHTPPTHT